MHPPPPPPSFEEVYGHLQATRYLSAAGLVVLLYDHVLTLDIEIQLVWKAKWTLPKTLFLINRYMVPLVMLINAYQLIGLYGNTFPDVFCKAWSAIVIVLGMISIAIGNLLVLLRLWVVWERNRRFIYWTLFGYIVNQIAVIVITSFTIVNLIPRVVVQFSSCLESAKVNIAGLWIPGIIFEFGVFSATCWNAFDRPRDANNPVTQALYLDGFLYFIVLFALRMINLVLTFVAPLSLAYLSIFIVWSANNVTLARLIFNCRKITSENRHTEDLQEEEVDQTADRYPSTSYELQLKSQLSQTNTLSPCATPSERTFT